MLQALNKKGHPIIIASQSKEMIDRMRDEPFFCPHCNGQVIIRAGPKTTPHFAHKSVIHCIHQKGEGEYHEQGKLLLYNWLKRQKFSVHLEQYIPEIKQVPDLLLKINDSRIALEFQCSQISINEIIKRNIGYKKANIRPIWILGEKLLKRYSNRAFTMNFFTSQFIHHFSKTSCTTLFYFCPHSKNMIIVNDIYMIQMKRALARFTIQKLDSLPFNKLFKKRIISKEKLFTLWLKEKEKFRLNRRHNLYGQELQWRKWLYNQGLFIENLPACIYLPIQSQYLFKSPPWQWQSHFIIDFIHPLQIGETFTLEKAKRFLRNKMYELSGISPLEFVVDPVLEYVEYLKMIQIIIEIKRNDYMKNRSVRFYKNIEEAMVGDKMLMHYMKRIMHNIG